MSKNLSYFYSLISQMQTNLEKQFDDLLDQLREAESIIKERSMLNKITTNAAQEEFLQTEKSVLGGSVLPKTEHLSFGDAVGAWYRTT